jgi:hypothetical protein
MSDIRTIAWAAALAAAVTLSAPAGAADLRRPPPQANVPPSIIWTGFHVGAHAGFAFSGEDATSAFFGTPVTLSTNPSGALGGLQAAMIISSRRIGWSAPSSTCPGRRRAATSISSPSRRAAPLPAASSTATTIGTIPLPAVSDI